MLANYELLQVLPGSIGLVPRNPSDWKTNVFAYANFILAGPDPASQLA